MNGEYVRIWTEDGIELQGLFCEPKIASDKAILHIHGLAGNFYENRFVDYVADEVVNRGYNFLTVNTRGHDYLSDFLKKSDHELTYVQIGCMHEILKECVFDIRGWINFLRDRGCSKIALEGHSTGAIKVVYYQSELKDPRISALILLSPSDDIGLQKNQLGDRYNEALRVARQLLAEGKEKDLMPSGFFDYPVSAKAYIDMFGPETKHGIFSFAEGRVRELEDINCPILALYGTVREAVVGDVQDSLMVIKKSAKQSKICETAVIEGAPHNYLQHERELATVIGNWIYEHV